MSERQRIQREMNAVIARMHAADEQATASWHQLRMRHGWVLWATLGVAGGLTAWWRLRRGGGQSPAPDAPRTVWRMLLRGVLPGVLPHLVMGLVPLPWRHWVGHPLLRSVLASALKKREAARNKGAQ